MAYELIETIEIGAGGAASIEFTSIPQDGVDLVLQLSLRNERAYYMDNVRVFINGVNALSGIALYADGTYGVSSFASTLLDTVAASATSNTFGSIQLYISNYTASANHSYSIENVVENNSTNNWNLKIQANKDNLTAGVTSLRFEEPSATDKFVQYSSISLYKIS